MEHPPAYVKIACGTTRRLLIGRFRRLPGEQPVWELTTTFAQSRQADPGESASIGELTGTFGPAATYEGCPQCSARSFVKCGKCQRLSCWTGAGWFSCGWCGDAGPVNDRIRSVSQAD